MLVDEKLSPKFSSVAIVEGGLPHHGAKPNNRYYSLMVTSLPA